MATNFVENYLPPALIAQYFQNSVGYRYLSVCINSINDTSISCENFVKFGPVTPQLTELICKHVRYNTAKKTGTFSRISPDILILVTI